MFIAGNWKMFKNATEAADFVRELDDQLGDPAVQVGVGPPFTSLAAVQAVLGGSALRVYAQNVHWAADGAYTGEISTGMLLDLGVDGAITGHSERRQCFGETDEGVAKRTRAALDAGLAVIACVGELEEERDAGRTEEVLARQVSAIADVVEDTNGLVVAYEPVWAIGTGKTATPEIAQEAHAFVKGILDVSVLYGGSVKPENAFDLLSQPDVDGALVGGASLDVASFVEICRQGARTRS